MSCPATQSAPRLPRGAAAGGEEVLTARIPRLSPAELAALLSSAYGLAVGSIETLSGERDQNIAVSAPDGSCYTLKIANAAEPAAALALQNAALEHLARTDPGLPVPRLVRTMDGEGLAPARHAGTTFQARLISYLPGRPAFEFPATPAFREALGRLAARMDRALSDFDHPAADTAMIWDLGRASGLRDRIGFLADPVHRAMARRVMDDFDNRAAPALHTLRRQVIHNDINHNNIMRDPRDGAITGIIDFGDITRTCLVNEVAIAIAHQLYREPDIAGVGADVLRGFMAEWQLETAETEILFDLIKMRLLAREIIVCWRRALGGDAVPYRSDISALGWDALGRALDLDARKVTTSWRSL